MDLENGKFYSKDLTPLWQYEYQNKKNPPDDYYIPFDILLCFMSEVEK